MNCIKCKRLFNKLNEQYCKDCYELQILKGQCLNASVAALNQKYNPEHDVYAEKVLEVAKKLFEEAKKRGFLGW